MFKGSAALQYTLKKQAGKDATQNNKANSDRIVALRASGSFRVLLPAATWQRTTVAKWSNEVHQVASFIGAEVVDEKGKRFPLRETLHVHAESKDTRVPADLRGRPSSPSSETPWTNSPLHSRASSARRVSRCRAWGPSCARCPASARP